jgi:hypothetical protein
MRTLMCHDSSIRVKSTLGARTNGQGDMIAERALKGVWSAPALTYINES